MKELKYTFENLSYDQLKAHITIPQFQRSLVWSDPQKNEFINTVKEGNPFGSILVYQSNISKYEIIDGLQRFTTLRDYEKNPVKYLNISKDNYSEITTISKIMQKDIPNLSIEILEKKVVDSIKEVLQSMSLFDKKLCRSIRKAVVGEFGEAIRRITDEAIDEEVEKMIEVWQNDIDFRALKIPTIIYTGDGSELPDIFERLNTGGTKLSRYEVFASTWNSIKLKIEREDYLDYIEDLYKKKCERTKLSISNFEEGVIKRTKELSLYEFCFALGKKIKDSCEILFATYSDTQEDQVDSIGFTSLATVLGIPLKKLSILNKFINETTNVKNLMLLTDKIVESYKQIEKILKHYISTVDCKIFTKFIEAQILAILGTYFKLYYKVNEDLSVSQENTSRTIKENFSRYMPFAYLYDIISEFWAGSGDRKLAEELSKPISENRFTSFILKEKWETLLREWMNNQILKKAKNVSIETKLFLNFICKTKLEWHNNQIKYDIEHIIPKKRILDKNLDVSISAIGNLCLLPACDNRRKKDETVYEYLDRTSEITIINEDSAKKLYYPTRDELSFIRAGEDFNVDHYNRFLRDMGLE